MLWLPAITVLVFCNAVLLIAIAMAPMFRRRGLRAWRRRQARTTAEVRAELVADAGPRLLTLIHDPNENVAVEALSVIGRVPTRSSSALGSVARLAADAAPRVRVSATWACLKILSACPETLDLLRRDPSPDVRVLVVHAATSDRQRTLSAAAQQIVLDAMEDPAPAVRAAAVSSLAHVACARLVPSLIQRVSDPVLDIRLAAARLCARMAAADDVALCRILIDMDQRASRVLLASLARREQPLSVEVLTLASTSQAHDRISAIRLLGTTADSRARRALATLLADQDSSIRHESAAAAAASARIGYPRPLDPALVDRLLHRLAEEPVHAIVAEVVDALAYSLDPRVPVAFLQRIPSGRGSVRERLVESAALFAHLAQSAERRRVDEGA